MRRARPKAARETGLLPLQPGSLLGRDQEMATAASLLAQPGLRLLTLTGPPGIGKTRLAVEVARQVAAMFPDGVFFVDLAPVRDAALVPATVSQALGLREMPGTEPLDALIDYLQPRASLLLLDNFEQIVDAAAQVAELLATCGQLKCLVTSRVALRLSWEHQFPVPPLPVPDLAPAADRRPDPESLLGVPSVALFLERAQAVAPAFRITPESAAAVAEICVRLDGMPLAIELAAARVAVLGPGQIAARLGDRFHLLTRGSRSVYARHQTLRGVIDWSYELLTAEEQAVLRRLGVFAGPFTLAAAAEVAAGPPVPGDRSLDLIAALVDHSLIVVEASQHAPYRLLETIREYALQRLEEAGEMQAARARHLAHYLHLAESGAHGLEGPRDTARAHEIAEQYENVRAAMAWAQQQEDDLRGLRLAIAAAGRIWAGRIHPTEARQWLEGWLRRTVAPPELRARGLYWAGELAWEVGDSDRAVAALEESVALFRRLGHRAGVSSALNTLAVVWYRRGDYGPAKRALAESLELAGDGDDPGADAFALFVRGIIARLEGDYASAERWGRESVAVARAGGLTRATALALDSLGVLAIHRGDPASGERLSREALALFRKLGDAYGTAASLNTLALAALARGDTRQARARSLESLPISRRVAAQGSAGRSLLTLARAAIADGELAQAAAHVGEAIAAFRAADERLGLIQTLETLGILAVRRGEAATAVRMLSAAALAREALGAVAPPADREALDDAVRSARALVPSEARRDLEAGAREMGLDEATRDAAAAVRSLAAAEVSAIPDARRLEVRLLGGFEVRRAGHPLPHTAWRRRRDRLLFCFLLIAREPVPRDALLEALWPDLPPASARASLNVAWSNVKRTIEPDAAPGQGYLVLERGRYGFRRDLVRTDAEEFEHWVSEAGRAPDARQALAALEHAAGLYRGDLLPDAANEPWTTVERERLRAAYVATLERLAEAKAAAGRLAEAEGRLREVLRLDPWREEVYRRLMTLLAERGRRSEALRLYQECAQALRRELDVEPCPETVALYKTLAAGRDPDPAPRLEPR